MSSAADGGGSATAEAGPEGDAQREELVAILRDRLGDGVLQTEVAGGDVWARLDRAVWGKAARVLQRNLDMDYFCFVSGIDWMVNPDLSGEKVWDPDGGLPDEDGAADEPVADPSGGYVTGVAGGATRFQLLARVFSTTRKVGITLKADLDDADPRAASWVPVYRGADWHEREAWEMYGFTFDGHPGLRHMYLPGEFEGHPLRKDFPLLAREVKPWPGLVDVEAMPGEEPAEDGEGGDA